MPILKKETDLYPADLLQRQDLLDDSSRQWYCVYTMSRREKQLMRRLVALSVPFYGPVVPKRFRSPAGRLRTSFVPLFPNYVFMLASEEQRYEALTTNCISQCRLVDAPEQLVGDLASIRVAIQSGLPLTPESKLQPGERVVVRSGPFKGFEGHVIRREGKTRLLLSVKFLEQGVSMEFDEALLVPH